MKANDAIRITQVERSVNEWSFGPELKITMLLKLEPIQDGIALRGTEECFVTFGREVFRQLEELNKKMENKLQI